MGPRLISRGNAMPPVQYLDRATVCFNGATADQPWKFGPWVDILYLLGGFNGATADQPWKLKLAKFSVIWVCRLQWGHG